MMIALLLAVHAVGLYAWTLFTKWEVEDNTEQIKANGSKDTLHEVFHLKRTVLRAVVAISLSIATSALLWRTLPLWALAAAGLICLYCGYFVWKFNPALNLARNLPAGYVSKAKNAAVFDRVLNWLGAPLMPVLWGLLGLGVAAYAVAMVNVFTRL